MLDSGSLLGRMSWFPWQLPQLATAVSPYLEASPWKDAW